MKNLLIVSIMLFIYGYTIAQVWDLENKSNQMALIKNFYSKNNEIIFELDFVEIKVTPINDMGPDFDLEIINKNPKIRIYKLSKKAIIEDCLENEQINTSNILKYKNKILKNKSYFVSFDVENGEIKLINLGCWN